MIITITMVVVTINYDYDKDNNAKSITRKMKYTTDTLLTGSFSFAKLTKSDEK